MLPCATPVFLFLLSTPRHKLCRFSGCSVRNTCRGTGFLQTSGPTGSMGIWHGMCDVSVPLSCAAVRRTRQRRAGGN